MVSLSRSDQPTTPVFIDSRLNLCQSWNSSKVRIVEILCIKSTLFEQLYTHSYRASLRNTVVAGIRPIVVVCHLLYNWKSRKALARNNEVTLVVDRHRAQVLDAEEKNITTTHLSGSIYIDCFQFDSLSHSSDDIYLAKTRPDG